MAILGGYLAYALLYSGETFPLRLYGTYPSLVAEDLEGHEVDIADLRGRPLLVLYVAERTTWTRGQHAMSAIESYVDEHPEFRALVLVRAKGEPITFTRESTGLPVLRWDKEAHRGWGDWGGAAAPALYVLDADGMVVRTWDGPLTSLGLNQLVADAPLGSRGTPGGQP